MQKREREDWLSRIDAALAALKREPKLSEPPRDRAGEHRGDGEVTSRDA